MAWTGSLQFSMANLAAARMGSTQQVVCVVPWDENDACDSADEGSVAITAPAAGTAIASLGERQGLKYRRVYLRNFVYTGSGLAPAADDFVRGTITPATGVWPGFNVGEGLAMFGGGSGYANMPAIHFGAHGAATAVVPANVTLVTDRPGRKIYRARTRYSIDSHLVVGGEDSLLVEWLWYFYPGTQMMDYRVCIYFSDMLHSAPGTATNTDPVQMECQIPGPIYISTPENTPVAWGLRLKYAAQRGGGSHVGVLDELDDRVYATAHTDTLTMTHTSVLAFIGSMASPDRSAADEAWFANLVTGSGIGEPRAIADPSEWPDYVPLYGAVPNWHSSLQTPANAETARNYRWDAWKTELEALISGTHIYDAPPGEWCLGPQPSGTGMHGDFGYDRLAGALGIVYGNPAWIEEAEFLHLHYFIRGNHFRWPGPGEGSPVQGANGDLVAATDGSPLRWHQLPRGANAREHLMVNASVDTLSGLMHKSTLHRWGKFWDFTAEGLQPLNIAPSGTYPADAWNWGNHPHASNNLERCYALLSGDELAMMQIEDRATSYLYFGRSADRRSGTRYASEYRSARHDQQLVQMHDVCTDSTIRAAIVQRFEDRAELPYHAAEPNSERWSHTWWTWKAAVIAAHGFYRSISPAGWDGWSWWRRSDNETNVRVCNLSPCWETMLALGYWCAWKLTGHAWWEDFVYLQLRGWIDQCWYYRTTRPPWGANEAGPLYPSDAAGADWYTIYFMCVPWTLPPGDPFLAGREFFGSLPPADWFSNDMYAGGVGANNHVVMLERYNGQRTYLSWVHHYDDDLYTWPVIGLMRAFLDIAGRVSTASMSAAELAHHNAMKLKATQILQSRLDRWDAKVFSADMLNDRRADWMHVTDYDPRLRSFREDERVGIRERTYFVITSPGSQVWTFSDRVAARETTSMVGGETNPDIEFGPGRIVPAYHAYATLAYTEIPPPRVIAVSGTFRANVSIDGTFDAKTITGTFDGTEDVPGTM